MSFKRDGDDTSLLNRLQHKRVSDLLGEHVPEDEAKLLSNGRLTCLICSHRPVFDTINILVIHRKGNKHTQELHKYLAHKQRLELKESKRIQFESIRKQQQLNKGNLGAKTLQPAATSQKRKKIDITSKNPFGVTQVPSASSQVRRYLKEISKKTPLSKIVYEQKESYPEAKVPKLDDPVITENKYKLSISDSSEKTSLVKKRSPDGETEASLLFLHTSGWIRDKFGNLIKDPEAEFDSSDEDI